jgi:hypothetical protein
MIELFLGCGALLSAYLLLDLLVLSRLRSIPVKIEGVTIEVKTTLGTDLDFYHASVAYEFDGESRGYGVNGYIRKRKIDQLILEGNRMKGTNALLMRPTANYPFINRSFLRPPTGLYLVGFFFFAFPFLVMAFQRISGKHLIYELIMVLVA